MDVEQLHARRLLSNAAAAAATAVASPGPTGQVEEGRAARAIAFSSLDVTVITILSLLLCALVIGLVLHAVFRCAFHVTRRVCYGQEPPGAEASGERAALAGAGAGARRKGKGSAIRGLPPTLVYSAENELAVCGSTECAICLAEFAQGERVRVLPGCNHGFHVRCIDRWLSARQTCPTCRRVPFAKSALPTRAGADAEAPAPAAVQLQVHVEAGQPETL